MTAERLPEDDFDQRLTAALQQAALPKTPMIAGSVQRLVRCRRQQFMVLGLASAAAVLLAVYIGISWFNAPRPPAGPGETQVAQQGKKLEGLSLLVSRPPVVAVTPAQDDWLAVLEKEAEGGQR